MNEQEFRQLSAGHALGALSPADEDEFAAALAAHPHWANIVDEDHDTAAALAEQAPEVAPPAHIRAQLMNAIAQTGSAGSFGGESLADAPTQTATPTSTGGGSADSFGAPNKKVKRNWRRGMFALAASIAVLSAIAFGPKIQTVLFPPPAEVMALKEIQEAPDATFASTQLEGGGEATAHWSGEIGKAVLVADGLPEIDEDRTFELWFVRGETPLPAGTFDAKDGESTALLTGEMQAGDTIAVTIEQTGGSPEGLPTTDAILAIATT